MVFLQELKSMRTPPLLPDSIMARLRPSPRTGSHRVGAFKGFSETKAHPILILSNSKAKAFLRQKLTPSYMQFKGKKKDFFLGLLLK